MCEELILHIGHGKTGSSYLQSVLAINRELLLGKGIYYPEHKSDSAARLGRISSGNGSDFLEEAWLGDPSLRVLVSGERLFHALASDEAIQNLVLRRSKRPKVIVYTRDVLDMLHSVWAQSVKRGGNVKPLNTFLTSHSDPHHSRVLWWISAASRYGFDIELSNYSRRRNDLLHHFCRSCFGEEVEASSLVLPKALSVNRSLTAVESEVIRVVNASFPESSGRIADQLVNLLPDFPSSRAKINSAVYELLHSRYIGLIEKLNCHLTKEDQLMFGDRSQFVGETDTQHCLSDKQFDVIVRGISSILNGC